MQRRFLTIETGTEIITKTPINLITPTSQGRSAFQTRLPLAKSHLDKAKVSLHLKFQRMVPAFFMSSIVIDVSANNALQPTVKTLRVLPSAELVR